MSSTPELLLSHGYLLAGDARERRIMRPYPPLGLLSLSAFLKRRGHAVEVMDATFAAPGDFERRLREVRPPVVGLYANLMTRATVLRSIRAAREAGAAVVLGGPEPANYADEYLDAGADVVVEGEGEETLAELLPRLLDAGPRDLDDVCGLFWRARGSAQTRRTPARKRIPDLDALPFPDREAIDLSRYLEAWRRHHGRSSVSLITARGCPFTCRWCSHGVYGFSHRQRSPESTADELALIHERYRPDMVWYADDVFTINRRWLERYADELDRRSLRLPFETISREDRLDEETVRRLARMGCLRLWIGSESGSQAVLDRMDRRTDAARVREMVALLQRHGIEAGVFIMLGYEGETLEDVEATVDHLRRALPDQVMTTVSYPIKGTPYYDEVESRIAARRAWHEGSDRDLWVSGRASPRFYRFAIRWILGEVARERERRRERPRPLRLLRTGADATLGRWGARMTWRNGARAAR